VRSLTARVSHTALSLELFRGFAAAESGCAIISHTADLSPIERRFPPDLSST